MANKHTATGVTRKAFVVIPNPHAELVNRIKSVTAALCSAPSPRQRQALLDELGTLTRILTDLIVEKEGGMRNPLETLSRSGLQLVSKKAR